MVSNIVTPGKKSVSFKILRELFGIFLLTKYNREKKPKKKNNRA